MRSLIFFVLTIISISSVADNSKRSVFRNISMNEAITISFNTRFELEKQYGRSTGGPYGHMQKIYLSRLSLGEQIKVGEFVAMVCQSLAEASYVSCLEIGIKESADLQAREAVESCPEIHARAGNSAMSHRASCLNEILF